MRRVIINAAALICVLATAVFADNVAVSSAPVKQDKLQVMNLNDIRQFDKSDILKKVPLDTGKLVFNAYFLEPRQLLRFHKHPATDELFYIVEGRGQFTVGNNQVMVDPGSAVYGPAGVNHGIVNSGTKEMVVVSVQGPKPVQINYAENSTIICPVCGQEDIIPANAKEGDIFVCPRCQARLKLSKTKDGKWQATQL
jgi:mannose-6-phosphate isomerase-like protein (cupin superfamily)